VSNPTCTVTDCDKPARSPRASLCPMHYHRQYRHGDVDRVSTGERTFVRRYKRKSAKGHPLVNRNGTAYVHRIVLYDAIGPGPHPCHWCSVDLHWLPEPGQEGLHVDHLDGVGDNNALDNLVASCKRCNSARGVKARRDALAALGFWSNHDTIAAMRERVTDSKFFGHVAS